MKIRLLSLVVALLALVACSKPTFNVKVELQNAEGKMERQDLFVPNMSRMYLKLLSTKSMQ